MQITVSVTVEVPASGTIDDIEPLVAAAGARAMRAAVQAVCREYEHRVVACIDWWTLIEEWWRRPIRRSYYELLLADDRLMAVFRDDVSGAWYAQRDA